MRRLIAILIGMAVASATGQAASRHTHVYPDHDHPEHRHGLAAHAHDSAHAHPEDGVPRFDACDPGQHTVSVVIGCGVLTKPQPLAADSGAPAVIQPLLAGRFVQPFAQPRAHGPPRAGPISPRAPPPLLS